MERNFLEILQRFLKTDFFGVLQKVQLKMSPKESQFTSFILDLIQFGPPRPGHGSNRGKTILMDKVLFYEAKYQF